MNISSLRQLFFTFAAVMALVVSTPALASSYEGMYSPDNPSPVAIGADAVAIRPISLAATVVGGALFVVALPFAIINRSVGETGKKLVVTPARYTFTRPLGQFEHSQRIPR